jgi:hypothetical protein
MTADRPARIEVHRGADRFRTRLDWLDSRHSFAFGAHHDSANIRHGALLVSNDDRVAPGYGFETHPHRDMEIVTWVLSGSLVHQDSVGNSGVIHRGLAQRMSAGTGILHSEKNDAWRLAGAAPHDDAVHFVQMWILPDEAGIEPGYEQCDLDERDLAGRLAPIASGMARHRGVAAIRIHNRHAALHAGHLGGGETAVLPEAPYVHLYVARGTVEAEAIATLHTGDAVRLTATGGQRITAIGAAEVLVWEMQ